MSTNNRRNVAFRPLRTLKSGKIAVATYMQWRKVHCAGYAGCALTILDEYRSMPQGAQVHNYKGEPLFFYGYEPDEHTSFPYPRGLDCDGVPTFTHYTAENIVKHYFDRAEDLEPLTVERVVSWFGWFLYRLNNASFAA